MSDVSICCLTKEYIHTGATWGHVDSVRCSWCLVQSTVNLRIQEKALLRCTYAVLVHQGFHLLQPPHLIKVINMQQLAQKINNWFRCKVPPPSYAACIFILTVNTIGSSANLRKKICSGSAWIDGFSAGCSFRFNVMVLFWS